MNWQPLLLTAKLASLVSLILLVLGLPLGCWLAFTRLRWKFLIESVVALPVVLPPTVLGFYLLLALGRDTAFGRALERLAGHTLAFSFPGLVIASVVYSLPFAVQPFSAGFASVDRRLLEAAATLGASRPAIFRRVLLPLAWPGILAGVVLSFAHTVGEFGVVLMVGGNLPGVTRTVSVQIYDQVQDLDYAAAHRTSLVLLGLSFAVLALLYGLGRRGRPA